MIEKLRQVFRIRTILVVSTVCGILALLLAYFAPFVHPKTLTLLPFFGLSYWIILLFNVLLIVIWAIMRSRWALIILVFLFLGGRLHFRMFSFGSDEENTTGNELKLLSYNVRLFDLYNAVHSESYETRNKIFDYILESDPDVMCFQEFYHREPPTQFVTKDSLLQIMNIADYHERYAERNFAHQNFGIAIFSKFPIIEKGFVNFPNQNNSFNYCIYTDVVKVDTFRIYNVHLQSIRLEKNDYAVFEEGESGESSSNIFSVMNKIRKAYPVRAAQAELIMKHAENSPYPVIICGDFNDTPLSYTYNQFNASLVDEFRNTSKGTGSTYAGNIPVGRIDYIFHSPKIGSREFRIQKERLSDHYAIDCKLFLKK